VIGEIPHGIKEVLAEVIAHRCEGLVVAGVLAEREKFLAQLGEVGRWLGSAEAGAKICFAPCRLQAEPADLGAADRMTFPVPVDVCDVEERLELEPVIPLCGQQVGDAAFRRAYARRPADHSKPNHGTFRATETEL
jgi:hypothetical protein